MHVVQLKSVIAVNSQNRLYHVTTRWLDLSRTRHEQLESGRPSNVHRWYDNKCRKRRSFGRKRNRPLWERGSTRSHLDYGRPRLHCLLSNNDFLIGGLTLTKGSSAATSDDQTVSAGSDGVVVGTFKMSLSNIASMMSTEQETQLCRRRPAAWRLKLAASRCIALTLCYFLF